MSEFRQIGTVEILRARVYRIDPQLNKNLTGHEALVQPGEYPVISDGLSYLWIMRGKLTNASVNRGDGLFMFTPGVDTTIDVEVQFTSPFFGPDEWQDLLDHPIATEGHPDQRLRFKIGATT